MSALPYTLADPAPPAETLGLIVLQVDQTIEGEFRRLFPPGVALHVSRIPSGAELNPRTIAAMETALPLAAALLPPAARFGAVGYACTSGTTLIGQARVAALVQGGCAAGAVTDPLSAAIAALRHLGARSVAIVSPYIAAVAGPIRLAFEAAGFDVPCALSFGEEVEARVARIDPASIRGAAEAAMRSGADAIFLSCTNLRSLEVIDALESASGKPVLSSNLALAWHMARLAGAPLAEGAPGRILRTR